MSQTGVSEITSDRIQDALYAFTRSQILFTAIELDIFTLIASGADTLTAIRERLDLSRRGARMLLNGLVGAGFLTVTEKGGTYTLPPDVKRFLVRQEAEYLGGMVHHGRLLYENWSQLTDAVRFGRPAGGAQSLAQLEAHFAALVKGLYVSNYPSAKRLATLMANLPVSPSVTYPEGAEFHPSSVLDVAGGSAVWSIAMLENFTTCRATVLDFDSVLPVAREYIAQHNLSERYSYQPGDLEALSLPPAQYDLAIMANICHALGPVSTRKAFHQIYQTIRPGGRLVVVDFTPDDRRSKAGWPMVFGVNMLVTTPEGDVFTAAEYENWLRASGFIHITFHELEADVTAIIAER